MPLNERIGEIPEAITQSNFCRPKNKSLRLSNARQLRSQMVKKLFQLFQPFSKAKRGFLGLLKKGSITKMEREPGKLETSYRTFGRKIEKVCSDLIQINDQLLSPVVYQN